jgi:hypothetical protein
MTEISDERLRTDSLLYIHLNSPDQTTEIARLGADGSVTYRQRPIQELTRDELLSAFGDALRSMVTIWAPSVAQKKAECAASGCVWPDDPDTEHLECTAGHFDGRGQCRLCKRCGRWMRPPPVMVAP